MGKFQEGENSHSVNYATRTIESLTFNGSQAANFAFSGQTVHYQHVCKDIQRNDESTFLN